jgi:hypothetical protein
MCVRMTENDQIRSISHLCLTKEIWERGQTNLPVQLTNLIVLNPYAAKLLVSVLNRVVAIYESEFGASRRTLVRRPMQLKRKGPH